MVIASSPGAFMVMPVHSIKSGMRYNYWGLPKFFLKMLGFARIFDSESILSCIQRMHT